MALDPNFAGRTLNRAEIGRLGEDIAVRMLVETGGEILERNWRVRQGEIDIIVFYPQTRTLSFVEVKTRTTNICGTPLEAVTQNKYLRLRGLVGQWLATHNISADEVRIDLVGVELVTGLPAKVTHVKGVG